MSTVAVIDGGILYTAILRKVVGKKYQSACNKTERWSGYSLEFCILA